MSLLAINGQRAVTFALTIPAYGATVADVSMASAMALGASADLQVGNLHVKSAVFRAAPFAGVQSARIVGGYGGWRKVIKARGYSHEAGVRMSSVLGDAARECGEKINVVADRALGLSWVREKARGERTLHQLAPNSWWIDTAGVTQIGATRSSALIKSPFTVVTWQGGRGRFEIATEVYEDWMPGRTFSAPTITGVQTVNTVMMTGDNDGKIRTVILTEANRGENRLLDEIRSVIRSEVPSLSYCAFWQYKIVSVNGKKISAIPLDPNGIMPPLADVPPMPGLMGETVTQTIGNTCIIAFLDASPAGARWISADGDALSVAIDATLEVKIGAGTRPIIGAGDFAGPFPCVPTQVLGKI